MRSQRSNQQRRKQPVSKNDDPARSSDLLEKLHAGESMIATPEEKRMSNLIKRTKEESAG
jgi:hypothetical protein